MKDIYLLLILILSCKVGFSQNLTNSNWNTTNIVDGDTFYAAQNNKEYKFRLIGIDAPESCHPNKPVQAYSNEAKRELEKLLYATEIFIEFDIQQQDQYGRYLAYVYIDDLFVNSHLVKSGLANLMTIAPNSKYTDVLLESLESAKRARVGLWSE